MITAEESKKVEDTAITDLVEKQKKAGYHVITDGEFRRATWHLDFMWGFNGVGHSATENGLPFHDEAAKIDDTFLTGKISVGHHPFVEHFKFVKALEDENTAAKQTIPAPAQFLEQLVMPMNIEDTRKIYPNDEELIADLVAGYKKVIADLYAAGCRNIQLDDCTWGCFVDPKARIFFGTDDAGLEKLQKEFLEINNLVIEGKPEDLVINTHICRGNFHSTWACTGAYDKVAELVFGKEQVNALYLEFDDARSGGFECLSHVSDDKKVVITTKFPKLEDKAAAMHGGCGNFRPFVFLYDIVSSQQWSPQLLPQKPPPRKTPQPRQIPLQKHPLWKRLQPQQTPQKPLPRKTPQPRWTPLQ